MTAFQDNSHNNDWQGGMPNSWVRVIRPHWEIYVLAMTAISSRPQNKLDMSTARRCLKSPQSLYGTSTHPTMVTHRSQSWSWMINSQPFLSMSISAPPPFLKKGYHKPWPLNYKVKVMGVVKGQDHTVSSVSNWFAFFLFHINQITIPQIQLFWNLTLKNQRSRSWVRSKVKIT